MRKRTGWITKSTSAAVVAGGVMFSSVVGIASVESGSGAPVSSSLAEGGTRWAGNPTDGPATPTRVVVELVRPTIALYGDSRAWEAHDYFVWFAVERGWEPEVHVFGGTAPCDWSDELATDLVDPPDLVVVAFSGNSLTDCMVDPTTGEHFEGTRHTEKYRADVGWFAESAAAAGSRVAIVAPPVSASGGGAKFHAVYQEIARATGGEFVDGGATIAPAGVHTPTMPCFLDEHASLGCTDGRIRVRAADGGHFCPTDPVAVNGVTPTCPVYASGARRYAEHLLSAIEQGTSL